MQANPTDVDVFMAREWAPENLHRFGRTDAEMWAKTPGYLAAYEGEELVGAARYYTRAGVGHLSELLVAASQRGMGIGGALLGRFEEVAREAGCHKLTLVTYGDPQTVGFYRKHGYAVEAVLYRDVYETDMCQMAKFISNRSPADSDH